MHAAARATITFLIKSQGSPYLKNTLWNQNFFSMKSTLITPSTYSCSALELSINGILCIIGYSSFNRYLLRLATSWSRRCFSKITSLYRDRSVSASFKIQSNQNVHITVVSASCEILRIYIVKLNSTHFSASRQDRMLYKHCQRHYRPRHWLL